MADEISPLTDEELRKKLRSHGLPDGPITKTTRKLFEAKLARAMGLEEIGGKPSKSLPEKVDEVVLVYEKSNTTINGCTDNTINDSTSNSCSSSTEKCRNTNTIIDSSNREESSFYGVCLHTMDCKAENQDGCAVFTDKLEALECVKKNSGARFRAFSTRNEAEAFALGKLPTPSRQSTQDPSPAPSDPASEYKSPKPGEVIRYRKLLEKGAADEVLNLIYSNPKYLITSCDIPVIVQEGCHYNSMHVAAKAGQKDICKIIFDALNDEEFWKLMYPVKESSLHNQQQCLRRKAFVLDLYLNTPDKGGGETPLHFACKFGKADVVEYLLSCPSVEKNITNKEGKTAEQIICTRVPGGGEILRSRIQSLFQNLETVCVPILRSDDNCSFPKMGVLWSPGVQGKRDDVVDAGNPGEPRYKVCAYAGPMSPQEAEKFCFALRSPKATPEKQAKFRHIKRSDSDKGLERVARKVAKLQRVLWCEYWKFLDCFADLSTIEGLKKLENYLQARHEVLRKQNADCLKTPVSCKCPSVGSIHEHFRGDESFDALESSPLSGIRREVLATRSGERKANIKNFRSKLNLDEFPESNNDEHLQISKTIGESDWGVNVAGKTADDDDVNNTDHDVRVFQDPKSIEEKEPENGSIKKHIPVYSDGNCLSPDYHERSVDISNCSEDSLSGLIPEFRMLSMDESPRCEEDSTDLDENPRSSAESLTEEDESPNCKESPKSCNKGLEPREEPSTLRPNSPKYDKKDTEAIVNHGDDVSLFIEGFQPSKVDLDVFRAIKDTTIDPALFPRISHWQERVRSFSKAARQAWPSPGSPRFYEVRSGILKTWSC